MRAEVKRTIGGKDYVFYQFSATEGLRTWIRITKVIGDSIGVLADSAINKGLKVDVKELNIDKAVSSLCENLDADDTVILIKHILSQVMFEGKRVNEIFDAHFENGYMQIFQVLKVALEVNYKDFLLEITGRLGMANQAK